MIVDFLRQFRNRRVLYFPNPGNAGDSLIAAATILLFRRLNIMFEPIDIGNDVRGEVVLIGGGGNLVPAYGSVATAFRNYLGRARQIVLLPHTVRGHEDLLQQMDSSCTLICRDPGSYMHVLDHAPAAAAHLDHDMAFYLTPQELLEDSKADAYQAFFVERLERARIKWPLRGTVRYFRRDGEATGQHRHTDMDPSAVFDTGARPGTIMPSAWAFLEAIRTVNAIETDRLHVGIAAAVLGVPCTLHDNAYGKNIAVYRHSIRNRYHNVTLAS